MAGPDDPRTMDTMLIGQLKAYLTGFWPDGRPVDGLELADATKAPHALMTMIVAGTPPLSDEEKVVALALFRKPRGVHAVLGTAGPPKLTSASRLTQPDPCQQWRRHRERHHPSAQLPHPGDG